MGLKPRGRYHDTKNGQPRAVPLTRHAMDVLAKVKKRPPHPTSKGNSAKAIMGAIGKTGWHK